MSSDESATERIVECDNSSVGKQRVESAVAVVQVLEIGERSNGRWNGSRELVGVQFSVNRIKPSG